MSTQAGGSWRCLSVRHSPLTGTSFVRRRRDCARSHSSATTGDDRNAPVPIVSQSFDGRGHVGNKTLPKAFEQLRTHTAASGFERAASRSAVIGGSHRWPLLRSCGSKCITRHVRLHFAAAPPGSATIATSTTAIKHNIKQKVPACILLMFNQPSNSCGHRDLQ
jgi:hypothetical protein